MNNIEVQIIKDMYKAGSSYRAIGSRLGYHHSAVRTEVELLIRMGELERVEIPKQSAEVSTRQKRVYEMCMRGLNNKEIAAKLQITPELVRYDKGQLRKQGYSLEIKPEAPQKEGTVYCTPAVSKTCIYGIKNNIECGLCRYFDCTGMLRTVDYPDSKGCSYKACNKYVKITKETPRIEGKKF